MPADPRNPLTAVAVIVALSRERDALGRGLRLAAGPAAGVEARLCGPGAGNAARAARAAVEDGARALVSFGCAGGLVPAAGSGTVVLPEAVRDGTGATIEVDGVWRRRLAAAVGAAVPVVGGAGIEIAAAVETPRDKEALHRESGCVFADMESASIGAVARAHRLPFLVVRAVADTVSDAVPACVSGMVSDQGRVRPGRLIAALAGNSGQILAVLALARRFRDACASLETVARHLPAASAGAGSGAAAGGSPGALPCGR